MPCQSHRLLIMKPKLSRLSASLFLLAALAGCAIQKDRAGRLQIQLDEAELFGRTVQTFRMPDGSDASLRLANGRYSIKLARQMTVIPIENAALAEIASVAELGRRQLIVVAKSRPGCPFANQLLSVDGREVLSWEIGDCFHSASVQVSGERASFDYRQDNGNTIRYLYRDGRLNREDVRASATNTGSSPGLARPIARGEPNYQPHPPAPPLGADRPLATASPAAQPQRRPQSAPQAAPGEAQPRLRPGDFATQEQKPLRIILDK